MYEKIIKNKCWFICVALFIAATFSFAVYINTQKIKTDIPRTVTLTALNDKDSRSSGYEVWIEEIAVDGKALDLQGLFNQKNVTYLYNKILLMPDNGSVTIEIPDGKNLELTVIKHNWSGYISISTNEYENSLNLFSKISQHECIALGNQSGFKANVSFITFIFLFAFLIIFYLMKEILDSRKRKLGIFSGVALFVLIIFLVTGTNFAKWSTWVWIISIILLLFGGTYCIILPLIRKYLDQKNYGIFLVCVLLGIVLAIMALKTSDFNYCDLWLANQMNRYPINLAIYPSGEKNELAESTELWLNYLVYDGKTQPLNSSVDWETSNWTLVDNSRLYCSNATSVSPYKLEGVNLPVSIGTVYSPYSGIAKVSLNNFTKEVDLYQADIEWGFLSVDYLFYNEIMQDINRYLFPNQFASVIYYLLAGIIGGTYLGLLPLSLCFITKRQPSLYWACCIAITIIAFGGLYLITANRLYSNQFLELNVANKKNVESTGNWITIYDISSSGVADGNNGQELKHEAPATWHRQYKNGVIFSSNTPANDPLVYNYRVLGTNPHMYSDNRKNTYDAGNGIFIKLKKGPDGGILSLKKNGEEQFIDCYSPVERVDYVQVDVLFDSEYSRESKIFHQIIYWLFGGIIFGSIFYFRKTVTDIIGIIYLNYKTLNLKTHILMFLLSLYCSFALFGQGLLFDEFQIWKPGAWRIVCFLLITFLISILIPVFFRVLDSYCGVRGKSKRKLYKTRQIFLMTFFSCMLVLLLWYFAFYPGVVNADVNAQWNQTQELTFYSNWHPIFHTLLIKFLAGPDNTLSTVVLFQLVFISGIIARILTFLYERYYTTASILIITIIILILPNSVIYIDLTKDVLGTFSYLWILFLLSKFLIDGPQLFWGRKVNILELAVAFIFVSNIRHNGQFICAPVALIMILISIICKYKTRFIVLSFGSIFLLNSCLNMGMYQYTHYYNYTEGLKYVTPVNDLASLVQNDLIIDADTTMLLEKVMPIEQWKTAYNPYYASDAVLKNNIDYTAIYRNFKLSNVLNLYLKNLKEYPGYIIRSRLLGSYLIWGIRESKDPHAYNKHVYFEVRSNPFGLERKNTLLKGLGKNYVLTYRNLEFLDIVIWRGGIHIVFLLGIILYLYVRNKSKYILILIPSILFTAALIISTPALNYRYVHYLYLTSLYMIALLPVIINKTKEG